MLSGIWLDLISRRNLKDRWRVLGGFGGFAVGRLLPYLAGDLGQYRRFQFHAGPHLGDVRRRWRLWACGEAEACGAFGAPGAPGILGPGIAGKGGLGGDGCPGKV